MGGQAQVNNWHSTVEAAETIGKIPGLTESERNELQASMASAIDNETSTVRKGALALKLKSIVEAAASGKGYGVVFSAALKALVG